MTRKGSPGDRERAVHRIWAERDNSARGPPHHELIVARFAPTPDLPNHYRRQVIIWLNGTFGAGKTTTGTLVAAHDPRLRLFDPEWVGYMLRNNLADHDFTDFQQLTSWRRLTPLVADELIRVTNQHLVAVQTVLDEDYWRELMSGLTALGHEVLHVVIEADQQVMRQRIHGDENEPRAATWRIDHLPTYAAARTWMTAGADLVLDTTDLTPQDAADQVWKLVEDRV